MLIAKHAKCTNLHGIRKINILKFDLHFLSSYVGNPNSSCASIVEHTRAGYCNLGNTFVRHPATFHFSQHNVLQYIVLKN